MKIKHSILVIVLLFQFGHGNSQPTRNRVEFNGLILYADSLKAKEDISSLIRILKREVNLENHDEKILSFYYYNLAICYSARDLIDSSCFFLSMALDHSSDYNNLIYTDSDFENFHDVPCWGRIIQKIDSAFISKNQEIRNKQLAIELYHIYLMDQHVRGLGLKKISKRLNSIDSTNLVRVEEIIKVYGWPTFSLVGETASLGAFLVIQHGNIHVQQQYLKSIFDAAMINEASKEWVALLMDRISVVKKGVQIFGTQVYKIRDPINMQKVTYDYFPIRDETQVDSLRKAFDMIPLKEYYARYGIDYKPAEE